MSAPTLTLEYYEPHEMACLKDGDRVLRYGNYWDFHAGCNGPKMQFADGTEIDFSAVWTDDINRPHTVATMVAKRIGAKVAVAYRQTPFPGC